MAERHDSVSNVMSLTASNQRIYKQSLTPPPTLAAVDTAATVISRRRQSGQCTHCMHVISLTSAGLLYSHGPGRPGSGLPPVAGSITSVAHQ